jgi:hypothetical protein
MVYLSRPRQNAADAGFAGIARCGRDRNMKPIEVVMACEAGRTSIGEWGATSQCANHALVEGGPIALT